MLPFLDDHDSHYSLAAGGVHSLPGGRRLGIVSIKSHQVVVAFVGTDPDWTGGITLRIGDTVHRGGLRLQLVQIGHDWLGQRTAEFEVTRAGRGERRASAENSSSGRRDQPEESAEEHTDPRTSAGRP